MEPHCEEISRVSYTNFGLSLFILVGILVSYLPQHIRIIRLRSSFGLSPYFVLLGTTSGTCAFANILVLPRSRADIACCREVDEFACLAGLLGIAQVGVQWACFGVILLLFLIFFPRNQLPSAPLDEDIADNVNPPDYSATSDIPPPSPVKENAPLAPSYRTALVVVAICVLHAAITAILSFYFIYAAPLHAQSWANFLGILSTVLASIQYFPQIYTTYTLKRVGSLSIPMMCIQTPGSFVFAGSLALRLGPEGWSAWGVYLVTGCLQGTLLVMGIYFEVVRRRREKEELKRRIHYNPSVEPEETTGREASEETPLLRSG
ncbi:uncharacterized protein Z520_02019 [Fonsecaea multimorphosa CBS 102226]|uniref:PQ loop repeat protein n=1 Tax=Fonsecaea multimorphosa CBS 102226 TaxID=1442371 RepID=A0A0D2HJ16_9EURO|nr:uncharacterized protein Z520_02019 [Fonsecaea multimorphosa CBS 102226]KIY01881.1 hypothetical protein Z520_02019 [Fonsecaea multimorphosa CBS 102226]OAL29566.1 hypothetical protein AYO22_01980 [Fonsecaea multimorphosa]